MHLVQEHGACPQVLGIHLAIVSHPFGNIPDMPTQIQTGVSPLRHPSRSSAQMRANTQALQPPLGRKGRWRESPALGLRRRGPQQRVVHARESSAHRGAFATSVNALQRRPPALVRPLHLKKTPPHRPNRSKRFKRFKRFGKLQTTSSTQPLALDESERVSPSPQPQGFALIHFHPDPHPHELHL